MEVATQDNVLELCGQLLEYIKAYKGETEAFIPTNGDDIWSFYKTVQTEYSALKKAAEKGDVSRLRSSNYKYLIEVWNVVTTVPKFYGLQRFFSTDTKKDSATIQIDIIAGDATQKRYFIKVSTIDEKRIGHELIKATWDGIDSDEEDSESISGPTGAISHIPTAILARQLLSASRMAGAVPILVLPCVDRHDDHGLFQYLDSLHLRCHCGSDSGPVINGVLSPQQIALDISTLISLISDVCNMPPHSIEFERNPHPQVEQVESEASAPLLAGSIYPYLQTADELIITPGAISKINSLLEYMGSDTEKKRAAILLGQTTSDEPLLSQWTRLTIYPPSPSLPLPIRIVHVQENMAAPLTEEEAEKLSPEAMELYDLALSYPGGCDVATGNKTLAKMIRAYYFVEQNSLGVSGRVLLHQPRSLRGYGKIIHQHRET